MTKDEKDIVLIRAIRALKTRLPKLAIEIGYDEKTEQLEAIIEIGSKNGTGKLTIEGKNFKFITRYDQGDYFHINDDVVYEISELAFSWYLSYPESGPNEEWVKIWEEDGRIVKQVKTVTGWKIRK